MGKNPEGEKKKIQLQQLSWRNQPYLKNKTKQ